MIPHICTSHTDEDCETCLAIGEKYEEILNSHCSYQGVDDPSKCFHFDNDNILICEIAHECPRVIDYFENMPTEK